VKVLITTLRHGKTGRQFYRILVAKVYVMLGKFKKNRNLDFKESSNQKEMYRRSQEIYSVQPGLKIIIIII